MRNTEIAILFGKRAFFQGHQGIVRCYAKLRNIELQELNLANWLLVLCKRNRWSRIDIF